ncbi:hypothetical protein ACTOWA_00600 [Herbaspirillum seropedicae]|uniref:hypothetical protein n=1 Tax=Herbaspirillum seropedicae TaxID=964 RepID=UPI00285C930B|nr:hypothetical protein [Herbaspirillum seropedicae]MDR6397905.1 hypothetical protein [Herbaspirillum seropedicae]
MTKTLKARLERVKLLERELCAVRLVGCGVHVYLDKVKDRDAMLTTIRTFPATTVTFLGNVGSISDEINELLNAGYQVRIETLDV